MRTRAYPTPGMTVYPTHPADISFCFLIVGWSPAGRKYKGSHCKPQCLCGLSSLYMRTKITPSQPDAGLVLNRRRCSFCRPSGCRRTFPSRGQLRGSGKTESGKASQGSPKDFGGREHRLCRTPDLGGHERGKGTIPKERDRVSEGIPGQGLKSTVRTEDGFRVCPRVPWGPCWL